MLAEFFAKTMNLVDMDEVYAVVPLLNDYLKLKISYDLPTVC
jgi:hypothetical protein